MSEESVRVVRAGYEAYARGDFAGVFAILHPDIEIVQTDLLPWGGSYHGQAQARDFFRKLAEHIESHVEPQEFVEAGDDVMVIGRLRGHVRSNQNPFDLRIAHLWTVREGQAIRFAAYIDTPTMLRALNDA